MAMSLEEKRRRDAVRQAAIRAARRAAGLPTDYRTREQHTEKSRRWRAKNPELVRVKKRAAYHKTGGWAALVMRVGAYGLTVDQFHAKLESQDFSCGICRGDMGGFKREHIDHDHATGKVRGILCDNCNRGVGFFKDNPERLRAAADYLAA